MTAIYVHIPFCRTRCAYCDFATYSGLEELMPDYVSALKTELHSGPHTQASTLYIGGGTPSVLPLHLLSDLFQALHEAFGLCPNAEISFEANPGTVDLNYLREIHLLGVNRLSLGAQSANADELQILGRSHNWQQVIETVESARQAGYDNLSLDLMYGLPLQSLFGWKRTLESALALNPEHLSLYALKVEHGTRLEQHICQGALPSPDDDAAAEMYELAQESLAAAGYYHYEISNWARRSEPSVQPALEQPCEEISSFVCRHNLTYWRNQPYLGFGASAASWWKGIRRANVRHPADYVSHISAGTSPADESEQIDRQLEMGETMMLGLRLAEGVRDQDFRQRFGTGLGTAFGEQLSQLRDLGLLEWNETAARLTSRGRLLGNQVFERFLP